MTETLTQRARDVAGRLHFELRDWKPGDRFHFPSINAMTLDEAAAIISELVERIEGVWQDIETAPPACCVLAAYFDQGRIHYPGECLRYPPPNPTTIYNHFCGEFTARSASDAE